MDPQVDVKTSTRAQVVVLTTIAATLMVITFLISGSMEPTDRTNLRVSVTIIVGVCSLIGSLMIYVEHRARKMEDSDS